MILTKRFCLAHTRDIDVQQSEALKVIGRQHREVVALISDRTKALVRREDNSPTRRKAEWAESLTESISV